jgi:hypothetical protein
MPLNSDVRGMAIAVHTSASHACLPAKESIVIAASGVAALTGTGTYAWLTGYATEQLRVA